MLPIYRNQPIFETIPNPLSSFSKIISSQMCHPSTLLKIRVSPLSLETHWCLLSSPFSSYAHNLFSFFPFIIFKIGLLYLSIFVIPKISLLYTSRELFCPNLYKTLLNFMSWLWFWNISVEKICYRCSNLQYSLSLLRSIVINEIKAKKGLMKR